LDISKQHPPNSWETIKVQLHLQKILKTIPAQNTSSFIHFAITDGQISLNYVPIQSMVADGLTKDLTSEKHKYFISMLGLKPQMLE
jgi:hypothetical protein